MTIDLQTAYSISIKHAPPHVNIREARIADDYGREDMAKLAITHTVPNEVTYEQLLYYGDVWVFVDESDLLFYLWPVLQCFVAYKSSGDCDFYHSYLSALNLRWPAIVNLVTSVELHVIGGLLRQISGSDPDLDLGQYAYLSQIPIGLTSH